MGEAQQLTLEQAMDRIEQILQLLDSGKSTLDESLALFEEGTTLVRFCNEKLQQAKLRVKEVMAKNEPDESQAGEILSGTAEPISNRD